jgi:hypothetical protein
VIGVGPARYTEFLDYSNLSLELEVTRKIFEFIEEDQSAASFDDWKRLESGLTSIQECIKNIMNPDGSIQPKKTLKKSTKGTKKTHSEPPTKKSSNSKTTASKQEPKKLKHHSVFELLASRRPINAKRGT